MNSPNISKSRWLALASAMVTLLVACAPPPETLPPLKVVRVREAVSVADASARRFSGEVRGRYETVLAFRVPGKVVTRLVDLGAVVKPGQALARLDTADAALQSTQAEAQRAVAEADLKRYQELRAKNFISQSALDAREAGYKAAYAQAGLARNQTAYATLTADRAGVISAVLVEAGQVVAAGQPVFRIVPDGDREVSINVPEAEVARFKVGDMAQVKLWASGGEPVSGKVREVAAAADPATRTYAARIALPEADPRLPVGLTATVAFDTGNARGEILVPLTAIFQKDGKQALWIFGTDATAALRPVTVTRYTDHGAVIGTGLQPGERYIEAGVHKLVAGEKLRLADQASSAVAAK